MQRLELYLLLVMLLPIQRLDAQVPTKRLPGSINMPTSSQIYPALSGDGTYMVFYSNYTNTGDFQLMYSKKMRGGWDRGTAIDVFKANLDHIGSHCLSYDGRLLFFSSIRSKGIGGFDIWYCEREGDGWNSPQNIGKPVNTSGQEGHPSISADGNSLYFIRCDKMDVQDKERCVIYVARRKSNGRWSEATPLPAPVNMGHETSPRILMDNTTLIFSSDRPGGKGRQDLYITRKDEGHWSNPIAMDFLNTAANNEYISIPAGGNVVYYTDLYNKRHQLYKAILPEEFRPGKILLMTGSIKVDGVDPDTEVRVQAYDANKGELVASAEVVQPEGAFFLSLPEGPVYDFSVFPSRPGYTYHAMLIDMRSPDRSDWLKPDIRIDKIGVGARVQEVFTFVEGSSEPAPSAQTAFKRLSGFIKMNRGIQMDLVVVSDTTGQEWISTEAAVEVEEAATGQEPTADDEWIDDSAWFGEEVDSSAQDSENDGESLEEGHAAVYDESLALDRAMAVVNALQSYGCDISTITPDTDFAHKPFDNPVADSLGYVVEIRLLP